MLQQLTTDTVSSTERADYWRDIICAVYVKLDVEPVGSQPFSGSVTWSPWGETTVSRVSSEGQVVTRQLDGGSDDCLISLQLSGTGVVSQYGRDAFLQPGDFALYDATQPYQLSFESTFDQLVIQFPRQALIARNVHIESAVARTTCGARGLGAVTGSFIRTLESHGGDIKPGNRHMLGSQVVDFAAMAFAGDPPEESVARYNRQRVLNYVEQNLANPALSVAGVAQALGVSSRTIQKLFADDDVPLSTRIRLARLERARTALRDPARRHLTVAVIATDNGFGGPTQFARAFRAVYGCSPTDYRNAVH